MKHGLLVRMTAPLVAVSILLLLVGTTTAWYVHRLQTNSADIVAVNVASIRAAEELEIGVREIRTQINNFLLTGDRQYLARIRSACRSRNCRKHPRRHARICGIRPQ